MLGGVEENGDEVVRVDYYDFSNQTSFSFYIYFAEDQQHIYIRVWDIIQSGAEHRSALLETVNRFNHDYSYISIFVEEDQSVSVKYDVICANGESAGPVCLEAVRRIAGIITNLYPSLSPYTQKPVSE